MMSPSSSALNACPPLAAPSLLTVQTALDLVERGIDVHCVVDGTSSMRQFDRLTAFTVPPLRAPSPYSSIRYDGYVMI